ncbi:MAG: DinB family protein [Candidatus Thorarchaeota archaeon]|jgi:hypothetical protein
MKIKRTTLLKKMLYRRKQWDLTIDSVIAKHGESDRISQKWHLKDVIAHITWYERELLDALEKKSTVESEFWNMDVEERNKLIFANTQDQTLTDLLAVSKSAFDNLVKKIETISDEDLNSEIYIKRKQGTRITHDFIGGITFWHYEDHEDARPRRCSH